MGKKLKAKVVNIDLDSSDLDAGILPDVNVDDTVKKRETSEPGLTQKTIGDSTFKIFLRKIFSGDYNNKINSPPSSLHNMMWEYVIILKNPDFPGLVNVGVTPQKSESLFKKFFRPKKTGNLHADRLKFLNELSAFQSVYQELKNFEGGKALYKGERMTVNDGIVKDTAETAKDFTSLIRHSIIYKLVGSLGLKAKQVMSKSGEHIYLIITADENDLEIEAERIRFSKQLEIALVDIQSLIPCDASLRPLHLLKINDPDINSISKDVKPFLRKAFKLEKNPEKVDYKYEPHSVTPMMIKAYKMYLCLLKEGIQKIESNVTSLKNQMFLFQKLIKDSIEKANLGMNDENKLKNLWDRLGIEKSIAPYAEFRISGADDELRTM